MFCLSQPHAYSIPNQRIQAFIFLCGEVKGAEMPPRHAKILLTCPTPSLIQGSESVNVVNNTQGLFGGGSGTVRKPQRIYA